MWNNKWEIRIPQRKRVKYPRVKDLKQPWEDQCLDIIETWRYVPGQESLKYRYSRLQATNELPRKVCESLMETT